MNNKIHNNKVLDDFITYIQDERKYSEYTVTNYQKDVLEFEEFLKANSFGVLTKPLHNSGRYYTAHLNEHYRKPRSVARKLSSLRSFYRYCLNNSLVEANPFDDVSSPKLDKTLHKF